VAKLEITKFFLDRAKVQRAIGKARARNLSKVGAFVRRAAKSLLRYRKGPSAPGSPASVHKSDQFTVQKKNRKTGQTKRQPASPLRELIFFGLDESADSVVIGPTPFAKGEAPRLEEFGGTVTRRRIIAVSTTGRKAKTPRQAAAYRAKILAGEIVPKARTKVITYSATYPRRSFMSPALARESRNEKLAKIWANSIRS
jgi:hypothetical protein